MGLFNFLFKKKTTHTFSNSLKESGNVFLMLFGAVGMVGVIGASTMTVMKGPVKTMSQVTKRTIAENNIIAAGKLALIASSGNDCDSDGTAEPIPFGTTLAGLTGGGTLPASIGVAKQDPWGTEYGYCTWDHGSDADETCGASSNFQTGSDPVSGYVLAIISAGPDKTFNTTCDDYTIPSAPLLNKANGADDIVLGYTSDEASAIAGGLWTDDSGTATIDQDLSVKDGATEKFAFDLATQTLEIGDSGTGVGKFPNVQTDFLSSFNNTPIDVSSPLSSDSAITTTGNISGVNIIGSGTLDIDGDVTLGDNVADTTAITGIATVGGTLGVTGATTLDGLTANTTSLGGTTSSSLSVTNNTSIGGTLTMSGDNIILGSNYLTGDGTGDDGITINADGDVTGSGDIAATGALNSATLATTGNATVGGTLGVTGATTLAGLTAGTTSLGATTLSGDLAMGTNLITGLGAPTADDHAVTKKYVDDEITAAGSAADDLGDHTATQNLDLNSNKVINMADPTAASDGATKSYVDSAVVAGADDLGNHIATKVLSMANNKITNVTNPTLAQDAATKAYVDAATSGGPSGDEIKDADNDTKIQVEEGADEDTIRFDTAGTERMIILNDGKVGIGTATPGAQLHVGNSAAVGGVLPWVNRFGSLFTNEISIATSDDEYANIMSELILDSTANTNELMMSIGAGVTTKPGNTYDFTNAMYGLFAETRHEGTGTVDFQVGALGQARNESTGTIVENIGVRGATANTSTGTITDNKVISISDLQNSGTITNTYGIHIGDLSIGTQTNTPFSIYASDVNSKNYFAGHVGIGTTDPKSLLHIDGDLLLSNAATTCGADQKGALRLNASADGLEMCDGVSAWSAFGNGAADNLGNHTATTNIQLGSNFLSGDGDNEGISIDASGKVAINNSDTDGIFTITGGPDITTANTAGQGAIVIQDNTADSTNFKLRIDSNELQSSHDGIASGIHINKFGGNVNIGTSGNSNLIMNNGKIAGLATPTDNADAATKAYVDAAGGADDLGDHEATQSIDLNTFKLVGNNGTTGIAIDATGNVTVDGTVDLGTDKIINLADPTVAQDAATKSYVDTAVVAGADDLGNHIATQNLNLNTANKIINLADPTLAQDAATKKYVDDNEADTLADLSCTDGQVAKWNNTGSVWACATDVGGGAGDNLGNHTATTALAMATNKITGLGTPTAGTDAATKSYVDTAVAGAGSGDELADADNDTKIQVEEGADEDIIRFDTAGTERMVIASDGDVGIGTTTPADDLHVYDSAGYGSILLNGNSAAGSAIKLLSLGDGSKGISDATTNGWAFAAIGNTFATPTNRDDFILSYYDGATQNSILYVKHDTGNIGIGISTPKSKLHVDGDLLLSNSATTCGADQKGALRMNASADGLEMCDGVSAWNAYAGGDGDTLASLSCSSNQIAKWNGSAWACAADGGSAGGDDLGNHTATTAIDMATNKVTNLGTPTAAADAATKGYVDGLTDDDTLAGLSCTDGQIAEWDNTGSAWVCATAASGADNLGNHTATTAVDMATNKVTNAGGMIFAGVAGNAPTK